MINVGDVVYSKRNYIDTEFGWSLRAYAKDGKVVHLITNNKYKVISVSDQSIEVINEFGAHYWYDIKIFDKVKEMRRQKLINLKKNYDINL